MHVYVIVCEFVSAQRAWYAQCCFRKIQSSAWWKEFCVITVSGVLTASQTWMSDFSSRHVRFDGSDCDGQTCLYHGRMKAV